MLNFFVIVQLSLGCCLPSWVVFTEIGEAEGTSNFDLGLSLEVLLDVIITVSGI